MNYERENAQSTTLSIEDKVKARYPDFG